MRPPYLTLLFVIPLAGALLAAFLPRRAARITAGVATLLTLLLALAVATSYNPGGGFELTERYDWIPQYGISYELGVDGISVWLIVLNAFLGFIAVLATPDRIARENRFLGLLLFMQAGMTGVFLATDLVLFYVFWEAMLIPAYFLIWQWGEGDAAGRAAVKFVLYTLAGSLLLLIGIIGEFVFTGSRSFDLRDLLAAPRPTAAVQFGLFALFALAFAIKVPVFPFHSWLPDAYMAAPTPMLVTFAGVMGKTGAYAFLRFVIPLFPHPVLWWDWNWVVVSLAVAGIIWGGFLALVQTDLKAIVAYSSISHMGFIVLGIFSLNRQGQQGAVLQMVNHGVIVPALFLIVAWVAVRTGARDRLRLSGLAPRMPVLTGLFLVVTLAALGLPGLNSFTGEFMTMLGAWQAAPVLAILACVGLVLTPVYMLRMYQGVTQGPAPTERARRRTDLAPIDITAFEGTVLVALIIPMLVLGVYPYLVTAAMR